MIKQKKVGSILNKFIPQGSTIGIIGGGQLGQMMAIIFLYTPDRLIPKDGSTYRVRLPENKT